MAYFIVSKCVFCFSGELFDLVQQLWIFLCYDVAFCIMVWLVWTHNYHPALQVTYNLPILKYYNNWNSCQPLCFFNISGVQSDANSRSGVIDAGRSERHDHIVVLTTQSLPYLYSFWSLVSETSQLSVHKSFKQHSILCLLLKISWLNL